jgi:hypothetical protein
VVLSAQNFGDICYDMLRASSQTYFHPKVGSVYSGIPARNVHVTGVQKKKKEEEEEKRS